MLEYSDFMILLYMQTNIGTVRLPQKKLQKMHIIIRVILNGQKKTVSLQILYEICLGISKRIY